MMTLRNHATRWMRKRRGLHAVARRLLGYVDAAYFQRVSNATKEKIKQSGYFDEAFYRELTGDAEIRSRPALDHYLQVGWRQGKPPSALFDGAWYLQNHDEARLSRRNPLVHYVERGAGLSYWPSPLFDPGFYVQQAVARGVPPPAEPLAHYISVGAALGIDPHPLFDTGFYLAQLPAGQELGRPALSHYLEQGSTHGLRPNVAFDPEFYRTRHRDVARAGIEPLVHYAAYGAKEHRQPSADFSILRYLAAHPDVAASGIDGLEHYVRWGHAEGRAREARTTLARDLMPAGPVALTAARTAIDIIVPVYGGLSETRACLESVLQSLPSNTSRARLVVIDDRGPDPAIGELLDGLSSNPHLTLLRNEQNMGFVATVNRGMALSPLSDVILLNSDTIVHGNWIDRLASQAYAAPDIGTVTPYSNNATICSYPTPTGSPELPDGETLASLDTAFGQANAGRSVVLPTGVGFCLYIRRACLDEVGLFDVERFGRGYGEENDFCLRAQRKGWLSILAGDVFVYHVGETSFAGDSSPGKERAAAILRGLYPSYESRVAAFVASGETGPIRFAATARRFALSNRQTILMISHGLGGGTGKHVAELAEAIGPSVRILHLTLRLETDVGLECQLSSLDENDLLNERFVARDARELAELLRSFRLARVHVHHTLGFNSVANEILIETGLAYDITVHDYYLICPRINLLKPDGRFCEVPPERECIQCLMQQPVTESPDIIWWRISAGQLIAGAERVLCPSRDVAERMSRLLPRDYLVVPHEEGFDQARRIHLAPLTPGMPLRVLVIGVMARHKGAQFLGACLAAWRKAGIRVELTLVGAPEPDCAGIFDNPLITVTGPYAAADVAGLIESADPHLIFYPQRWPETYSFTLSEGLRSGRPLLVPAIGAFLERTDGQDWVWRYAMSDRPADLTELLRNIRDQHLLPGTPPDTMAGERRTASGSGPVFYAGAYLAPLRRKGRT